MRRTKSALRHGSPIFIMADNLEFGRVWPSRQQGPDDIADMDELDEQLWSACSRGDQALAVTQLNGGANIEQEDGWWGRTPIMAASEKGHLDVMKMLHGRGANVHVQDNRGANALMLAALNGHADVATFLVTECGADVNAVGDEGFTALHWAAHEGFLDIVKMLQTHGKFDSKLVQRLATKAPTKQQHIRINFDSM